MDSRICNNQPYGEHIKLTCVNHPEKNWSTKNISHIGARSIFYENSFGEKPSMGRDCDCPIGFLVHTCSTCAYNRT